MMKSVEGACENQHETRKRLAPVEGGKEHHRDGNWSRQGHGVDGNMDRDDAACNGIPGKAEDPGDQFRQGDRDAAQHRHETGRRGMKRLGFDLHGVPQRTCMYITLRLPGGPFRRCAAGRGAAAHLC
jgi:hypothetical protein